MYDIHMHLVPNVDDGAADLAMSLEMLRTAKAEGIHAIIATPHSFAFRHHPEHTLRMYRKLHQAAKASGIGVSLYPGCEIRCDPSHMSSIVKLLDRGQYPTLNGTRYVLTEFHTSISPPEGEYCLEYLLDAGCIPVIAHAERYPLLLEEQAFFPRVRDRNCLIQCNVFSFLEEPNPRTRNAARDLLRRQLVDFLGSDAHRTDHRPPRAALGLKYLAGHCSNDYFRRITRGNAEKILGIKSAR